MNGDWAGVVIVETDSTFQNGFYIEVSRIDSVRLSLVDHGDIVTGRQFVVSWATEVRHVQGVPPDTAPRLPYFHDIATVGAYTPPTLHLEEASQFGVPYYRTLDLTVNGDRMSGHELIAVPTWIGINLSARAKIELQRVR